MEIRLDKCVPNLRVASVARALAYYRDVLGFAVDWDDEGLGFDHTMYASLSRGDCQICLTEHESDGNVGSVWCYVSDVRALYEEFAATGALIEQRPEAMPWGEVSMRLRDPDGNLICFNEPQQPPLDSD